MSAQLAKQYELLLDMLWEAHLVILDLGNRYLLLHNTRPSFQEESIMGVQTGVNTIIHRDAPDRSGP